MIDIQFDNGSNKNFPVLYIMDKYMEVLHSVHLKELKSVEVPGIGTLTLDENVGELFESCHLKAAMNKRQNVLINASQTSNVDEELYELLKNEFDNAPKFIEVEYIERLIENYSSNFNNSDIAYYRVCQCLKAWNERNITTLYQERTIQR